MPRGLILAARHPRPRLSGRICLGHADAPLAEPAEAGAAALLAAAGEPIGRIVSSPAEQAWPVAAALARRTGAALRADGRLREQDFGTWEGRAWSTIPQAELDGWAADPLHARPGGGESAEALLRRVRRAWTGIASAEETTLVLTHAGPLRCLLHLVLGMALPQALAAGVAYGAVVRFPPG